jgi:hypothetical protein
MGIHGCLLSGAERSRAFRSSQGSLTHRVYAIAYC